MGQQEIYNFLKENKGRYTSAEITNNVNYNRTTVCTSLRKLRNKGMIQYKDITIIGKRFRTEYWVE